VTDSVDEAATARKAYAGRKDTEAALEKAEREAKEAEDKAKAEQEAADKPADKDEENEKDDL